MTLPRPATIGIIGWLGLANLVLAMLAAWSLAPRRLPQIEAPASPAANEPVAATPALAMPGLDGFADMVERPLFTASRRQVALPAAGQPIEATALQVELVGVAIASERRTAILRHGTPPQLVTLSTGDEIAGWTLEAVLFNRVVFSRGPDRREVALKDTPPPKGAGPMKPRSPAELPIRPPNGDQAAAPRKP